MTKILHILLYTLSNTANQTIQAKRLVIAGGGTGGHLFPGIAIAQEFKARNPQNKILFVSTGNPFERSALSSAGFGLKTISAEGIKRLGRWKQLKSLMIIPKGIIGAIRILKDFKPDLVVGVGSYAAGPVVIGAWLLRKRVVLHEQNILPGITNRILSRFADRIYVSFNDTQNNFNPKKVCFTGNPVREEILTQSTNEKKVGLNANRSKDLFTILIIGGSQGAHSINTAVLDALKYLKRKDRYCFVHQTGAADVQKVNAAYKKYGMSGTVKAFFQDMFRQYQKADLIICRAGATTVAEVTAIGKGTIFIPFPFAADNHQALNAKKLAEAGAAELVPQKDLTGEILAKKIEYHASNPQGLEYMANKAKNFGKPEAARTIVDDIYQLLDS
jgi:UDP-N-acetylglucosamine--N-acetylmuramyl-(pentapeptide) pyrophosphoryl-undecaprenol N-acetylglucosamine transferase